MRLRRISPITLLISIVFLLAAYFAMNDRLHGNVGNQSRYWTFHIYLIYAYLLYGFIIICFPLEIYLFNGFKNKPTKLFFQSHAVKIAVLLSPLLLILLFQLVVILISH